MVHKMSCNYCVSFIDKFDGSNEGYCCYYPIRNKVSRDHSCSLFSLASVNSINDLFDSRSRYIDRLEVKVEECIKLQEILKQRNEEIKKLKLELKK
jgi:hypothetical protein